jgi:hypothetical protein
MFEHISLYPTDPNSQILEHNPTTRTAPYGLCKIVAVGYDQN